MKRFFLPIILLMITLSTSAGNTITYTASKELQEGNEGLHSYAFNVSITRHTFSKGIGTITFSGDVTSIGVDAFYGCSSLTSITIPEGVTSIGKSAFKGCSSLTSIIIPEGVTSIGKSAFSSCSSLTSVTIPEGVTSIGNAAFYKCSSLTSIIIPEGATSIGVDAFYGCSSLTSIIIPKGVTSIGDHAFCDCSSLTSVTIPEGVTSIGWFAFGKCSSLTSITIPEGVTSIGKWAFYNCSSLTSVTIPEGVTSIGDHAFCDCSSLTSITIPSSVTSIGEDAFTRCNNIKELTIPAFVISHFSYSEKRKNIEFIVLLQGATDIKERAFYGYSSLTSITIPEGVTSIGEDAFYECSSLTSITIPESVTSIGESAFYKCSSLTSVTIPKSVTSIGNWAFSNCSGLTSITIPSSVTSIGKSAFYNCSSLTSVTIPESVTSIGESTFNSCSSLTSITIPSSVTSIGEYAFNSCSSLSSIIIPKGVTSIGKSAFVGCSKLFIIYAGKKYDIYNGHLSKKIPQEEFCYWQDFEKYARGRVEKPFNEWQQQGEFERKAEWQKRVNAETRQAKIDELIKEAEQAYATYHLGQQKITTTLGRYDADNEVYLVTLGDYGTAYLAVPYDEARDFKANWDKRKENITYNVRDEKIGIATLAVTTPNRKTYTYRNTDAVTYDIADNMHFDPIEINLPTSGNQAPVITKKTTSSVDIEIPKTTTTNDKTFVLIFANERYKRVESVPFARNDGKVFQKYCQQTLGVPVKNIHFVEDATLGDMRAELAWASQVAEAYAGQASFIVYYAGHGIPDESSKSAYLLPVDGDGHLLESAYNLDDLYAKFGRLPAQHITIFMDACFSGSKREEGMLASARGVALKVKAGTPQGNMVVFSAATGDETAYPNKEQGHGMFTYYLLKKLQEAKGDVTLQELGDYITKNVRQQSIVLNGKSQTPTVTPATAVANEWGNWKLK